MSSGRSLRLPLAVLVTSMLVVFTPLAGDAARISLVIDDAPNRGFNSTRPVPGVSGNPGSTLGDQRVRAFEAAVREWERRLASPVEIRVLAAWENLGCTDTATLAVAGPYYWVRDFAGAPRDGTWYLGATADALFGEELLPDEVDLFMVFNDSIDGSPGCMGGAEWDYSIGTAPDPLGDVSMLDVTRHEVAHGLGFLPLVDVATGQKELGFDDAFMANLEDHSLGQSWTEMGNGQRATSTTDTDDLHWVGGGVLARSAHLSDGFDPSSGHVEMYAPRNLEGTSSVSHWDTDVRALFDELMHPASTGLEELLLTQHAMQDVGWAVDFQRVESLGDIDGNGVDDLVVSRIDRVSGRPSTVVFDPSSGAAIARTEYLRGYVSIDLAVVPDLGATPADEVALLALNQRLGAVQVFVTDGDSGEVLSQFGIDPRFSPVRLVSIPDFGGSPADEVGIFAVDPSGPSTRLVVKDAGTGAQLSNLGLPLGHLPGDVAVLGDFGGSDAPEVALLTWRPDLDTRQITVRDVRTNATLSIAQFEGFIPQYIAAVPSFAATAADEVAIVGRPTPDGGAELIVADASTAEVVGGGPIDAELLPLGILVMDDFADSGAGEVAVMGRRVADRGARVVVVDAASGAEIHTLSLPALRRPLEAVVLPSFSGNPADEIGLLVSTETDFRLRVFIDDPVAGASIGPALVPFDGEIGSVLAERPGVLLPGTGPRTPAPGGDAGPPPDGSTSPAETARHGPRAELPARPRRR